MIDVLADVVLVEPHGCVRRERDVLRVDEIELLLRGRRVEQAHVPEPRGRVLREHERDRRSRCPATMPAPISLPSAWRRSKRVGLRGPRRGVNSVVPPRCRRRYRFVGPPSSSLPTNRFSAVLPQSKRRIAPREVTSTLSPERLVRRLAVSTMYKIPAAQLQSCQAYCERRREGAVSRRRRRRRRTAPVRSARRSASRPAVRG